MWVLGYGLLEAIRFALVKGDHGLWSYVFSRTAPQYTTLPISYISLPDAFERRALLEYKLRGCERLQRYEGLNGDAFGEMLQFIDATSISEFIPKKVFDRRQPHSYEELIELLSLLSNLERQYVTKKLRSKNRKGTFREQALFWAGTVALNESLHSHPSSPCFLLVEDDVDLKVAHLHGRTLNDLCVDLLDFGGWTGQLWYHGGHPERESFQRFAPLIMRDTMRSIGSHFGSVAQLLTREGIVRRLRNIHLDGKYKFLNCVEWDCVADHFHEGSRKIDPVTPWANNLLSDRSTPGFHDDTNDWARSLTVAAIGSTYLQFELLSLSASQILLQAKQRYTLDTDICLLFAAALRMMHNTSYTQANFGFRIPLVLFDLEHAK